MVGAARRDKPPVILVAGPTASGKSGLALALAETFAGTVINADSMQVYRELPVLTARPGPAEAARAPHRLYGVLPVAEPCSAGRWLEMALAAIGEATAAGRLPVVVGGTGLYLDALVHGLAPVPPVPAAVRRAVTARLAAIGEAAFRGELAARDPAGAARIAAGDAQRLVRAREVLDATGRTLGEWQARQVAAPQFRFLPILLAPPRATLYAAIDARAARMLDAGAADEVAAVLRQGLEPQLPALKAVGFRELARWLDGRCGREAALAALQQATRRYAKRQTTWFRHRYRPEVTIIAQFSERLLPSVFPFIREFLLTPESPATRLRLSRCAAQREEG